MEGTIADEIRKRRQAMETQDGITSIQSLHADEDIETIGNENEDMIEALQTRRKQRQDELNEPQQGSSKEPASWAPDTEASSNRPPLPRSLPALKDEKSDTLTATAKRSADTSGSKLNASIRERLRSRVKGIQAKTDEGLSERKLRGLRELPIPNRFDEIKDEEEDVDPQLKASIKSAREWRKAKAKQRKPDGFPTDEEAYNFFVGTGTTSAEEDDKRVDERKPENASEDVVIDLFEDASTHWIKAPYVSKREQLEKENALYGYPSTIPALQEDKVAKGLIPRSLEDEGFYVGKPPSVSRTRISMMENRLLLSNNEDHSWFDENGDLKRLPNPVRDNPMRFPLTDDYPNPDLETFWGKAEVRQFDGKYINGDTGGRRYQLDIDVSTLTFMHHPLFSKEHVVASKLQQLYNQYCATMKKGLLIHLTSKLVTLREALVQLQELPQKMKKVRKSSIMRELDQRRKYYKTEIKQARRQRDDEEYRDRLLLKNIFRYWQDVKKIRETQGYTNTPIVLKIIRQAVNKEEEKEQYKKEIDEELQELREEYEEEYRDKYAEYEKQMSTWKKQMKLRKRKAQKKLEQSQLSPVLTQQNSEDDLEPLVRPEPPPEFDENAAVVSIEERLKKCRRRPGEAILTPELHSGVNVTPAEQCLRDEQLRRSDLKNGKYQVKVVFNDKEVSRTGAKSLTSDFTIHYGEILNVQVLHWPESIKLQIFNSSGWANTLLAELFVPIPEASMVSGTVGVEPFEFSSDHFVTYKHAGIGSGLAVDLNTQLDVEPEAPMTVLTSGILYSCVSWGIDNDGRPMAPPTRAHGRATGQSAVKYHDALSALGAAGVVDMEMLISWITEANLDPNDPRNADILNLAKVMTGGNKETISRPKYFRLNQLEGETDFATNEELDNCKRFKLIQLRDQRIPEFKNLKMIPNADKHISPSLFEACERRLKGQEQEQTEGEVSHRARVGNFLVQARKNVLARSQVAKRQLDLTDVVIEDEVPDIGTLGARLGQVFAKRHPLKPERKERKRIAGQNLASVREVRILINVVRAFDVPIRSESSRRGRLPASTHPHAGPNESMASAQTGMFTTAGRGLQTSHNSRMSAQQPQQQGGYNAAQSRIESLVRPFIEVMFQGNFVRTSVAEGPLPNWNEEIVVPFRAPNNDYSTDNLQTVKEKIYVNLFDEFIVDILQDERQRDTNIHQRVERFWLGSLSIPFSTVYFNSQVKGLMRINSPPVLLGYEPSRSKVSTSKCESYLQLFVTIEPQLQPAQPLAEKFETNEYETLIHNAQVWLSSVRSSHPDREYKAMVSDLDGKKVFVTRYIKAQRPPDGIISDTNLPSIQTMRLLARFVSLIPYIPDSVQFPDLCDIWTTSEQFLSMLAGDEEEHAVLLCNYFLSLGKKAWVVLGNGIPEGSTAYVLSLDGIRYQLWNASTGEFYEMNDMRCPLLSIGCLIDEANILANIQKEEHPSKLDMNFLNPKAWRPFFSKKYPNPGLASFQIERLAYHESDLQYFINLQDKLERTLKDKLMEWRPRFVTRWNRYCTQAFRNLLTNMEQKFAMGQPIEDHHSELEQVTSSYKLTGFPLQMSYTDTRPVLDAVYSTGVQNCEDPEAEFALAVHIHPYPNSIVAVWIYVGRLVKKLSYR